jgi:acyl-CoA thioester hydrolase
MGVVYHVHYLDHCEAARTELLRSRGLSYKELEDSGILIQVVEVSIRYRRPAFYDDVLEVRTHVEDSPASRLELSSEIWRVEPEPDPGAGLLATARITLCYVDTQRGRPVRAPDRLLKAIRGEPGGSA